ncbi:hypothetical protein MMC11_006768 [Xylographa trunciseda]|nr:hypothetical protein [Xylographa trunciseda]
MVASTTGAGAQAGGMEVMPHGGRLRLYVRDFANYVENDDELKRSPITNPLLWFADAKEARFVSFVLSHHLMMSSKKGKLTTRHRAFQRVMLDCDIEAIGRNKDGFNDPGGTKIYTVGMVEALAMIKARMA